jgi:hypothetical protein
VWDFSPVDEHAGLARYVTLPDMVAHVAQAGRTGPLALAFHPSIDPRIRARQFDLFCELCIRAGSLTMIVEELRFVTRPSWAPVPWQRCILTGRKSGLRIIATSQRPAHIDKDFLGNATLIHAGCLGYREDVATVASEMRLDAPELEALAPLAWVEFDRKTRLYRRGRIIF